MVIEQANETGLPIIGDVAVNLTGSMSYICYTDPVGLGTAEGYCHGNLCNTMQLYGMGLKQIQTNPAPKFPCKVQDATDPSNRPRWINMHFCYSW